MSQPNKKLQLHVQRKRKAKVSKTSPTETAVDKQPPAKLEKIQDLQTTEYYAVPRYARLATKNEIYAKNSAGIEFLMNLEDNKPVYATEIKIINDEEHTIEVAPLDADGKPTYIHDSNRIVYPMNLTTKRPIFRLNENLDEEYLTDDVVTEPHYPIDDQGNVYYARLNDGTDKPLADLEGIFYYGSDGNNIQVYPRKSDGSEFYLTNKQFHQFAALGADKIPYYATLSNSNQFYPLKPVE